MATTLVTFIYAFVTVLLLGFSLRKSLRTPHNTPLLSHIKIWATFGAVFGAFAFSWLYSVYQLPWMAPGVTQLFGIALLHLILISLCAVSYSFISLSFHPMIARKYVVLLFPLMLVCSELLRSLLISLLYSGNGGHVGLHFTASTTGDALSITPFVEFAYFGGTFALSAVLALLIFIPQSGWTRRAKTYSYGALLASFTVVHFLPVTLPATPLVVASISTDFTQESNPTKNPFLDQFPLVHKEIIEAAKAVPDILLLPEDARYSSNLTSITRTELLTKYKDVLLVDGTTINESDGLLNYSLFYNPNESVVTGRAKQFIFPFSEYIPTFFTPILSFFVGKESFADYQKHHTYTKRVSNGSYPHKGLNIQTILCSEILSFQTIRNISMSKPEIVLFQSQLSVFHKSILARAQLRMSTKTAAAQLRSTIISASNQFESYAISPHGTIVRVVEPSLSTTIYVISKEGVSVQAKP